MSAERNDANERRRDCDRCNAYGTVVYGGDDRTCLACSGRGWVDDDSTDPTNDAWTADTLNAAVSEQSAKEWKQRWEP